MKKIFLSTQIPDGKNAGSKAKLDVLQILDRSGYHSVYFPKFSSIAEVMSFWKTLSRSIEKGSHLVIEYPCVPRKRMTILFLMALLKRVRIYAIIHDISDLRFTETPKNSDIHFLRRFDGLVSHNSFMTTWLREKGYTKPVINLDVFDYCLNTSKTFHEEAVTDNLKVLYAGNLSFAKASYLYDRGLNQLKKAGLFVYGQSFDKEKMNGSKITYKGVFNPDTPELPENYHFGLIWEGTSIDTCTGEMGQYIRFNNPHKFSLYLALGLPVIAWRESAVAKYVEKHDLGITIGSLQELDEIATKVSQDDYQRYIRNITKIGARVRAGKFLESAMEQLVRN